MATVNIRRDVKDSFYRYKMPKLISKVSVSMYLSPPCQLKCVAKQVSLCMTNLG